MVPEPSANVLFNMGPKRPNRPDPRVVTGLQALAASVLGPGATVQITSGMGEYGSPRHRGGLAADATFLDPQGSPVTISDPRMRQLALAAPQYGFLGFGAGEEYMGNTSVHLDMFPHEQYSPDMAPTWGSFGRGIRDEFVSAISGRPVTTAQTSSQGAPMAGLMDTGRVSAQNTPSAGLMGMSPEPQGFRERLMRDVRSGDFADNLTLALNSLRMRPDQGLADMVMQRQEQRAQERQANRTAEWLASIGRTDLAEAIGSGALDARSAAVIAMTPQAAPEQTAAMQNYEFLRAQGVDDQTAMERSFGAGGTTVQNIMPGDDAFAGAFAKSDADAFAAVSSVGLNAQGQINQLVELENLLATAPQGAPGALVQFAGRLGIATEGLDEVQAAQAVMNRLTLQQRPPGSGPMTDRDLEFLMRSVPQIINQPGGNQLIIETMRRVAEYDIQGAQIVQALRAGEIDRAQAMEMLMSRENPLEGFQAPEGQPATSAPASGNRVRFNPETGAFE
jgi:hypothetical protein